MNQDVVWMFVRSLLLVGFSHLVWKGYLTDEQVTTLMGAAGVLFILGWQAVVRWNTKIVSASTGARGDVPTVSPVTGAVDANSPGA